MILLTNDVKTRMKSHDSQRKNKNSSLRFTMARLKISDSDIHDRYYGINVLAISFGLAHIRV